MKNAEMKNNATENKDLAPDMEARIRELEEAVKRARSHKESCDCKDCDTKRDFGLSRLKGFGKKLGGLFISTEPLKAEKISEAEAEEIETEKTEDEVKKADAKKAEAEDEAEIEAEKSDAKKAEAEADADAKKSDAKKAEAEAEKNEAKTTKIGVGGGFKKPKKESEYVQLFYTNSGKLLSANDIERIKNLPVSKNPISINEVEKFTVQLEGGLSCGIKKVPKKSESRAFLHVMSRTLISKADAELYKSYCLSDANDDPIAKVLKISACLVDEYGLEKAVDIDNF